MSSRNSLPKIDFLGSLNSHESSSTKTESSVSNEQSELSKFQKLKQYHNITKYVELANVPSVANVNSLQDTELNELLRNIDNLIFLSLQRIHKNDNSFHVEIENFKVAPQSETPTSRASNTKTPTSFSNEPSSTPEENDNLKYLNATFLKIKPETMPKINPISIESIVALDFLRNGLKSGTFQTQKFYTTNFVEQDVVLTSNAKANDTNSNASRESLYNKTIYSAVNTLSSLFAGGPQQQQKKSEQIKALSNTNKKMLIFKYVLILNLHKQCFEIKRVNDKEMTYTIVSTEKPPNWSHSDYETLTLEVKTSSILKRKDNTEKTSRHLNAKAIFDRLLRNFSTILKTEWPELRLKSGSLVRKSANNSKFKSKFTILDESKVIDISNNQLRIGFKWQGVKFKDLDVLLLINIGIKLQDEKVQAKLNESMTHILNSFVTRDSSGFHQNIERNLSAEDLNKICAWLKSHLSITFDQYFLVPNLVHFWLLDFRHLKLNFLKCLMFINCLNPRFQTTALNSQVTNPIVISNIADLLNGVTLPESVQSAAPSEFNIFKNKKPPSYNFIASLHNKSNLCLLLKVLQLCVNTVVASNDVVSKINDENLSLEMLIVDTILNEIRSSAGCNCWHIDSIFDRIWSCLFRIRQACLTSVLIDPLAIFPNVLPRVMVKHISFYKFEMITYPVILYTKQDKTKDTSYGKRSKSKSLVSEREKILGPEPLVKAFELMMKNVFSNIMADGENVFMLYLQSNSQPRESISLNLKYLMRLSVSTSSINDQVSSSNVIASRSSTKLRSINDANINKGKSIDEV